MEQKTTLNLDEILGLNLAKETPEKYQEKSEHLLSNSKVKNTPQDANPSFMQNPDIQAPLDLEETRLSLGLSRRQMCLLLKVDPSAWTRWMKSKKGAPLHIHQALGWYMQVIRQNPDLHAPLKLEKTFLQNKREQDLQIKALKRGLQFLKDQAFSKKDAMEILAQKIQESFENILIKFRNQMEPQKTLEIESLKYENRKLSDKLLDLEKILKELAGKKVAKELLKKKVTKEAKRAAPKKAFKKKSIKKKVIKKVSKTKNLAKKKRVQRRPQKKSLAKNSSSKGKKGQGYKEIF